MTRRAAARFTLLVLGALLGWGGLCGQALAIAPDGSFIRTPDGSIYRVAGGAPIHVNICGPLDGCPGLQAVSDLAGYASVPADGTFLRIADGPLTGFVARVAGGKPLGLATCVPLGGCDSAVNLDASGYADYAQAHPLIRDGAVVREAEGANNGLVARAAGGALMGLGTCGPIPECGGLVNLDAVSFDTYAREHPNVGDGTFVRIADGAQAGLVARAVGGALLPLATCVPLGGCGAAVSVDAAGFRAYTAGHPAPADSAFARVADGPSAGLSLRAAGGALLPLSDCAPLGDCPGAVALDSGGWSSYAAAHPQPADGTILQGVPSLGTWLLAGGTRQAAAASPRAVTVNDATLSAFPVVAPVGPAPSPAAPVTQGGSTTGARSSPAPRSAGPFTVVFLTAKANHRGRRLGLLFGVQVVGALPAGARLRVTCAGGCRFTKSYKIKRRAKTRTRVYAFGRRKLPITAATRITVTVSVPGRNARFSVYAFRRARLGLLAHNIRTGCRSATGAHGVVACG